MTASHTHRQTGREGRSTDTDRQTDRHTGRQHTWIHEPVHCFHGLPRQPDLLHVKLLGLHHLQAAVQVSLRCGGSPSPLGGPLILCHWGPPWGADLRLCPSLCEPVRVDTSRGEDLQEVELDVSLEKRLIDCVDVLGEGGGEGEEGGREGGGEGGMRRGGMEGGKEGGKEGGRRRGRERGEGGREGGGGKEGEGEGGREGRREGEGRRREGGREGGRDETKSENVQSAPFLPPSLPPSLFLPPSPSLPPSPLPH